MLDEAEFAEIWALLRDGLKGTKEFRKRHGVPVQDALTQELYSPLLQCYERLTGVKETNPNAVLHHRISLYGPPCKKCGKPLRSPRARLCGSCMFPVERARRLRKGSAPG
ncbi:MAG: hypothetical protein WBE72_03915 [Terracidiphilus sp.]